MAESIRQLKNKWKDLVAGNNFVAVFEAIGGRLSEGSRHSNDIRHLNARYNHNYQAEIINGTISREEALLEYNRIRNGLLALIDEVKQEDIGNGISLQDNFDELVKQLPV